jgi:hypothetical protein
VDITASTADFTTTVFILEVINAVSLSSLQADNDRYALMVWCLLNPREHGLGDGVAKAGARCAHPSATR